MKSERSQSIRSSLSLGPKISETQSEAMDRIRENFKILGPELRKLALAELIRGL